MWSLSENLGVQFPPKHLSDLNLVLDYVETMVCVTRLKVAVMRCEYRFEVLNSLAFVVGI
jgi:hypothetical protein